MPAMDIENSENEKKSIRYALEELIREGSVATKGRKRWPRYIITKACE